MADEDNLKLKLYFENGKFIFYIGYILRSDSKMINSII